MRDIVIFGCGGFGREVLQIIHALNEVEPRWNCLGFAVDFGVAHPETVHGLPVTDDLAAMCHGKTPDICIAIGAPNVRRGIAERLGANGFKFPTLIHPRAWIGEKVSFAEGAIVCAGACLTTDITVAEHVHINLCATIGHDASLGAFSTISPGANVSGNVVLGTGCDIGTGATVIQGVDLGHDVVIGAGAAVIRAIPSQCTAVGVPAKIIASPDKSA